MYTKLVIIFSWLPLHTHTKFKIRNWEWFTTDLYMLPNIENQYSLTLVSPQQKLKLWGSEATAMCNKIICSEKQDYKRNHRIHQLRVQCLLRTKWRDKKLYLFNEICGTILRVLENTWQVALLNFLKWWLQWRTLSKD